MLSKEKLVDKQIYKDEAAKFKAQNPTFDPITILMLVSLLVSVLQLIYECKKKSSEVKSIIRFPTTRSQVNRAIRRELGIINFVRFGSKLTDAVLKHGEELDNKHLQEMIDGLSTE